MKKLTLIIDVDKNIEEVRKKFITIAQEIPEIRNIYSFEDTFGEVCWQKDDIREVITRLSDITSEKLIEEIIEEVLIRLERTDEMVDETISRGWEILELVAEKVIDDFKEDKII